MQAKYIILVVLIFIALYQNTESFASTGQCASCTLEPNRKPLLSSQGALLPYPRYEWSYSPDQYHCTPDVVYNPYNGYSNDNKNHTYNPLQLDSIHKLYGIIPESQLYYVKTEWEEHPQRCIQVYQSKSQLTDK